MPVVCVYMNHVGDAYDENGEEVQQVECVMATNIPNEMDQVEDSHICVVMVGLPARGKSLIAQKSKLPLYPPSSATAFSLSGNSIWSCGYDV